MARPPGIDPASFDAQPPHPSWGVETPVRKSLSTREPILVAPPPARVCLSLEVRGQSPAVALVAPGQRVLRGEPIAEVPGSDMRIHASISGRVAALA